MLFAKFSYRFRLIAEYIKPFLDAYQAPFKDNCSYFLGIELILRAIYYLIGNRILGAYKTLAVCTLICMLFLIYLCTIRPFKATINTVLYTTYIFNAGSLVVLVTYFNYRINDTLYGILYNILQFIAFAEFGMVVLYYCYINYLNRIEKLAKLVEKITSMILNCRNSNKIVTQLESLPNFEQYQEELLAMDVN